MIPWLLAGSGWLAAALLLGLYLGERGRRQDAQLRAAGQPALPGRRVRKATTAAPAPSPASGLLGKDLETARDKYIADAVREGFDGDAAAADFDEMMTAINSDRAASFA